MKPAIEKGQLSMKRSRKIVFCLLFIFLGACTQRPLSPAEKTSPPNLVAPVHPLQEEKVLSESALFHEAVLYLGSPGQPADYAKARSTFGTLLRTYPGSKRRDLLEVILRLIDEEMLCQERKLSARVMIDKADAERRSLREENEQLKGDIRLLGDKFQAEITKLREENEQLKKDIQLLKNLEIQLDKREKMLR